MSYQKNSKNDCDFIGRLGKDAETETFESGKKVTRFSIATDEVITKKDAENEEVTTWIPLEIWGDHPAIPFLKKGKQVSVSARYKTSTAEKDGEKKYYHVFSAKEIILLGAAGSSDGNQAQSN